MRESNKTQRKVLVRALGGRPLERIVIEMGERVVYLSHPDLLAKVQRGASDPVGFPKEDVFVFDAGLYQRLNEQWRREGHTDPGVWTEAVGYGAEEPA